MSAQSLFRTAGVILVAFGVSGCGVPGPATSAEAMAPLRRDLSLPAKGNRMEAITVSYLVTGDPVGPRLILVHGTPGAAEGWADFLSDPPPGLEVVALDRPGFGLSGPEDAMTALADQADAVAALLPDDRPAILLGHSLGGPIAALAAARHPGRVAALILLAGSLDPGLETIHPLQRVGAWAPVRSMLPRAIRNANAELMDLEPQLEALRAELPLIRCPVLIVHGTDDDLVPFSNTAYAAANLTGACAVETTVLEGANHFLPWNAVAAVRAAIARAEEIRC